MKKLLATVAALAILSTSAAFAETAAMPTEASAPAVVEKVATTKTVKKHSMKKVKKHSMKKHAAKAAK
jgi:hypothetical protein